MSVDGERELEDFLAGSGALNFSDTEQPPEQEPEETEQEEVVPDERQPRIHLPGERPEPPSPVEQKPVEEQPEEEQAEEEGEPHVVWATKKYGTDPDKWAKAAFDQERFITQLATEKKRAEEMASEAIEYAQTVEAQAQSREGVGMPMSAAEEAWVEESMANPGAYAYQAARSGNVQLYNAVLERVAMENPSMAAHIGTQVNLALQNEMAQANAQRQAHMEAAQNGASGGDFTEAMGQSFQRLGINVQQYGQPMWEKIESLGEYHPYTLAILGGDAIQRDLAIQAVYDLVRTGQTTTQRVADTQREEQIKREGELRRNAAGVVTGAPHTPPQKQHPLFDAMEAEWRRRGQWTDEAE